MVAKQGLVKQNLRRAGRAPAKGTHPMHDHHASSGAYSGDETLADLLRVAGSRYGVAEVRALLSGLAAAPATGSAGDPAIWPLLIAPEPTPELVRELEALRSEIASRRRAPHDGPSARIARLRDELLSRGLSGFVVPRADEHQGEYVPACAQRLAWLTGFTGSAGLAVVLIEAGAVFTDGRYTLQVNEEIPRELLEAHHITENPPAVWIGHRLGAGGRLGYDPRLHTKGEVARLADACERAGGSLVAVEDNPVDAVWPDRPPAPLAPVVPHDIAHAGKSGAAKRQEIAEELERARVDAAVLTAPDSIAWLLNVRGGDVEHTPLPLGFALLHADARVDLFIDRRKLVPGLDAHLGNGVAIEPPSALGPALERLGADGRRVRVDGSTSVWVRDRLSGAVLVEDGDPCTLPKARKNADELAGARAAHRRDAAALARFLYWIDTHAPGGEVTELGAAEKLLELRRELDGFRDQSFPTISGAGPNGAIVHYRVSEASDRVLEPGTLYLVDSGAQFPDGTTDVTRTAAIGEPTDEMRERFTAVLQGHIAVATARFPHGTTGAQLDSLARSPLWRLGLDFDHGTGHGVGSYLSVHEGPQRISKRGGDQALEPGMIVSNEPGYYRTGEYGIRIENLLVVRRCPDLADAEREMLDFEVLTLAPIDRRLIVPERLTPFEQDWLDAYHARVRETVGPALDDDTREWLDRATAALGA